MKTKLETISLFKVFMNVSEASASVKDVLASGYIGEGKYVENFEDMLKDKVDNDNVACVKLAMEIMLYLLL